MTGYLMQTHGVYTTRALVYSLPLGLLGAAVVYANNLRDAEGDQHVGKYTLATPLVCAGAVLSTLFCCWLLMRSSLCWVFGMVPLT